MRLLLLLGKYDRVALIALIDRMKQGRFSDVQPKLVILKEDKLDILSFFDKFKHIYSNLKITKDIVEYTKLSLLLRRTYTKKERKKIIKQIREFKNYQEIQTNIVRGFRYNVISHLIYFVSYCFGLQTFDQLTKYHIIPDSQWVLTSNKQIKKITIPQYGIPTSFVCSLAKVVRYNHIDANMLINHGHHCLEAARCCLYAFYTLS